MMDDKRLQEIKAMAEAAVYDCDYMELESLALHSIPDLIAEVERLREQERLWSDGHIIVKLTDAENENARLRAELEAAKRDISSMLQAESYEELCVFCKSVRDEECVVGNCGNAKWRGLCAENGGAE